MTVLVLCLAVCAVIAAPGHRSVWPTFERPGATPIVTPHRAPKAQVGTRLRRLMVLISGRHHQRPHSLADLAELLAAPLRSGAPVASACAAVAGAVPHDSVEHALLEELVNGAREGHEASIVWERYAERWGSPEAAFVARAWRLSEQTGAPIAEALTCAAGVLRERSRAVQRLKAASAGPRASMAVLGMLPLAGPAVGLAFGINPVDLYMRTPLATAALGLGLVLAAAGLIWSRILLRRALRTRPVTS